MPLVAPESLAPSPPAALARHRRGRAFTPAFTLVELLVVILITGVLIGITVTVVTRLRTAAASTNCLSNLAQITLGFQQYAAANKGRLPDPQANETSFEQSLAPYVGSQSSFQCPADEELFGLLGSSYDWRDTPDPETTLAGKLLSAARGDAVLAFEALPGWHQKGRINAATCSGAVLTMDRDVCLADLDKPVQ